MKKDERKLIIPGLILLFLILGTVLIFGLSLWRANDSKTGQAGVSQQTLVTIKNSGSTNSTGWSLDVYSDGSGKLHCSSGPHRYQTCHDTSYKAGSFSVQTIPNDIANAHFNQRSNGCMRSVSFGTSETLVYNNESFNDFDCYMSENSTTALTMDVSAMLRQTGLDQ